MEEGCGGQGPLASPSMTCESPTTRSPCATSPFGIFIMWTSRAPNARFKKSTSCAAPFTTRYGVRVWYVSGTGLTMSVQRNARELIEMLAPRAVGRHEPLHALAGEHLARVDVPPGVGGDHVQAEELPAGLAHASELAHHLAVLAIEEPDVVVRQVGDEQILLRLVGREGDAAGRAPDARVLRQLELLLEVPLLVRDVDAVRVAIRGVDEPVVGEVGRELARKLIRHRA